MALHIISGLLERARNYGTITKASGCISCRIICRSFKAVEPALELVVDPKGEAQGKKDGTNEQNEKYSFHVHILW
jgi:hypothetical protein